MRNEWWKPRKPDQAIEQKNPWFHPAVTAYLATLIRPDWVVLEHGCGGSTLWLADLAKEVVSVEHDPTWLEAIKAAAPVNVSLYPATRTAAAFVPGAYDFIMIDGERGARIDWMNRAPSLCKPGAIVLVDNYNRAEYAEAVRKLSAAAEHMITFETNPVGHLNAVTALFRMPGGQPGETWV